MWPFGKNAKLERGMVGLAERLEELFRHSGCVSWAEMGGRIKKRNPLGIPAPTHAICPACDEMFERRKMGLWPMVDKTVVWIPGGGGLAETKRPADNAKLYCYSCHEKIKKAHGKENE